jgi:hypothetical protein
MPVPRGPFRPIPLTFKVAIHLTSSGSTRPEAIILHAKAPAAPTAAQTTAVAQAVVNAIAADGVVFPNTVTCDSVEVTDLNSAVGPQATVLSGTVGTGDAGVPDQAGVAILRTAKRGKSFTGRAFLPIPEDAVTTPAGVVTDVWEGRAATLFADIQTNLAALVPSGGLVVASRKLSTSEPVTTVEIRETYGRVRRRVFG